VTDSVATGYERTPSPKAVASSGNWVYGETAYDPRMRLATPQRNIPHLAALAILVATSSISSCADPWLETRQGRAQMTMASMFDPRARRRITGLEARRLALETLRRAEEARSAFAQSEARVGVDWEDVS